jgi:hypothetical protein
MFHCICVVSVVYKDVIQSKRRHPLSLFISIDIQFDVQVVKCIDRVYDTSGCSHDVSVGDESTYTRLDWTHWIINRTRGNDAQLKDLVCLRISNENWSSRISCTSPSCGRCSCTHLLLLRQIVHFVLTATGLKIDKFNVFYIIISDED